MIQTATFGDNRSGEIRTDDAAERTTSLATMPAPEKKPPFYEPAPEGAMHAYLIDDGAQHWIAAHSIREAIECWFADTEPEDYGEVTAKVLEHDEACRVAIFDEDDGETHSAAYWANKCTEAALIGCSEW